MFEENKHPRDKDGKFTSKGNEGSKEYRQNTDYKQILEDKYNSELPGKPKKKELSEQQLNELVNSYRKALRQGYAENKEGFRPYEDVFFIHGEDLIKQISTFELNKILQNIIPEGGNVQDLQGVLVARSTDAQKDYKLKFNSEIAKMSLNELREYKKHCKEVISNVREEQKKERQKKAETLAKEQELNKTNNKKRLEALNIPTKYAEALNKADNYRAKKEKELALFKNQLSYAQNGYVDGRKSVRAVKAELAGKFPASECAKLLGTTTKKIEENFKPSEWHHSGGDMYNKINYYDISKVLEILDDYDLAKDKDYKQTLDLINKIYN